MPDASVTAAEARQLAREILERSEYARHRRDPTWLQRWVDELSAWLDAQADRVASWMPDWLVAAWDGFWSGLRSLLETVLGDDALVVVLRIALLVVLLGAIAILARRVVRELRSGQEAQVATAPEPLAGPRLIDEAERLAAEGRFLEAAHCTQLASLQLLLHKNCLELERSDPNRTLRRRLQAAPLPEVVRERFLLLLDRLEGEWFRERQQDRGLYGEWRALHRQIEVLPEVR
jgi:hypothetical protein